MRNGAGCDTCPMIAAPLEVELQGQLDVARILRGIDLSQVSAQSGCRSIEVHSVECIQEIRTELESHAFRDVEVLLQAQVDVSITRTAYWTLSRAVAKLAHRCLPVWIRIEILVSDIRAGRRIECISPTKYFP